MAGENIKIGVALEFSGFGSPDIQKISKQINDAMKNAGAVETDFKIKVDEKSLSNLEAFKKSIAALVDEINSVLKSVTKLDSKIASMELVSSESIGKVKNELGNSLQDAMSKISNRIAIVTKTAVTAALEGLNGTQVNVVANIGKIIDADLTLGEEEGGRGADLKLDIDESQLSKVHD